MEWDEEGGQYLQGSSGQIEWMRRGKIMCRIQIFFLLFFRSATLDFLHRLWSQNYPTNVFCLIAKKSYPLKMFSLGKEFSVTTFCRIIKKPELQPGCSSLANVYILGSLVSPWRGFFGLKYGVSGEFRRSVLRTTTLFLFQRAKILARVRSPPLFFQT